MDEKERAIRREIRRKRNAKKIKRQKIVLSILGVLLVADIIFAICIGFYDKIMPNIVIGDTKVGGLTELKALDELEEFMGDVSSHSIKIKYKNTSKSIKLSDIDADVDLNNTVAQAYSYGRDSGIFKKMTAFLKCTLFKTRIEYTMSVNDGKVDNLINEIAYPYEKGIEQAGYELNGNILTIKKGQGGEMADRDDARSKIVNAVTNPSLSELEFKTKVIPKSTIDVNEVYNELTDAPEDAYYKKINSEITVIPEKPQVKISMNDLKKAAESDLDRYEIKVETVMPKVTTNELTSLMYRDVMGQYTSSFNSSNKERTENIRVAAGKINNFALMPGETFSYDSTIGERTKANGYKEAPVYIGNKVDSGIGGGICQVSSTLYSAALYANLKIVARTAHSLPVSYMPAGQDATIAEGYIDFKFKNNTDYPVKIVASVGANNVTVSLLGVKDKEISVKLEHTKTAETPPKTVRTLDAEIPVGHKLITKKGTNGYTIQSQRIIFKNGAELKRENLTKSVYHATDIEEFVNPADKDTESEKLTDFEGHEAVLKAEKIKNEQKKKQGV